MSLIVFTGPKGSGKDSAYKILKDEKKVIKKLSFASPLKSLINDVFKIEPLILNDPKMKDKPFKEIKSIGKDIELTSRILRKIKKEMLKYKDEYDSQGNNYYNIDIVSVAGIEGRIITSPRELLQVVGTDFIRNKIFKQWHVMSAFGEKYLPNKKGIAAITDLRFMSELEFLKQRVGENNLKVYYIERPSSEKILEEATHSSELEVKKIREIIGEENVIKNTGSLEEFSEKVLELELPAPTKLSKYSGQTSQDDSANSDTIRVGKLVYGKVK